MTARSSLAAAKERYVQRNPRSLQHWEFAASSLPGGNTRTVLFFEPFPLCMARGEECLLYDADGHRYVDFLGEFTAGIYGHSNPCIREAITAALQNGLSLSSHNAPEAELAREIRGRFKSMELLRFTNSGTEANIMALATAAAFTRRERFLVFENAYHGSVLSFGSPPSPLNLPYHFDVARYNDIEGVRSLLRQSGHNLAAVLVEPMLGAGGCIPGDPEFLRVLATETQAAGALLIFDEIQTSRLSPGGRQELLGIQPDLTTLGKYFGGGLSFGAFGGRREVMSRFDPRQADHLPHPGTFNNNILSMCAGLAGLRNVLTPEALTKLNALGESLRESLNDTFASLGTVLYATGLGSIMNLHARASRELTRVMRELLFFKLLERGFYVAPRGLLSLSIPITARMTQELVAAVGEIVADEMDVFRPETS